MDIDYISINVDYYYKPDNKTLYHKTYNIKTKDWVFIKIDSPITFEEALKLSEKKLDYRKIMDIEFIEALKEL